MTEREQTKGREESGAVSTDKPGTSDADIKRTGKKERASAGPDGPDPTVVGDTFKRIGG